MIDTLYQAATDRALDDLVKRPRPEVPTAPATTFGGFMAAPFEGLAGGAAESLAFGSEILGAFGQVMAATDARAGGMFSGMTPAERTQNEQAAFKVTQGPGIDFSNETGDLFRRRAAELMPDPQTTSAAEQLTAGLFNFGGKALGYTLGFGPMAPFALGGDVGMSEADRLKQAGVALGPRTAAGAVAGAIGGASIALPVVGPTAATTAALVGAVGPGGFIAQQAGERAILKAAGYDKIASTFDPFDPAGLALSTLVPAAFGAAAHAIRSRPTLPEVVKNLESAGQRYGPDDQLLTSPKGAQGEMQVMPKTATDPGFGVVPARDSSPEELARVGRDYLSAMQQRYGSEDKALAAYNA
ncbi:MAG TPA: lytic transglycosylase domain-containing protein, partial [Pseudolabrys sp.]